MTTPEFTQIDEAQKELAFRGCWNFGRGTIDHIEKDDGVITPIPALRFRHTKYGYNSAATIHTIDGEEYIRTDEIHRHGN